MTSQALPQTILESKTQIEEHPERTLASGRSVVIRTEGTSDVAEVRSAAGEVEVKITLTEKGPTVTLRGADLTLSSPDRIALYSQELELHAEKTALLRSEDQSDLFGREVRLQTSDNTWIDGRRVLVRALGWTTFPFTIQSAICRLGA